MSESRMPAASTPAPGDSTELHRCLPEVMRTTSTTITRIAAGMSGAGVFRVEAGEERFVLKITPSDQPIAQWRNHLAVQQSAAAAGIAPQIRHVDEDRRAVLSALIVDRSLPAHLGNPATRAAALLALGQMLRRRRDLPVPQGMEPVDAVRALHQMWETFPPEFTLPPFVGDAVSAVRAEPSQSDTRPPVMSHNDVNPSNLAFDGERVILLDWQTAAPNHPLYDLAAIAMFLRFDDATCRQLIAAHDDAPDDALPESFLHFRRVAAVLSGIAALRAARSRGHAGGDTARDTTPSLSDIYQQLRSGTFDLGSVGGQWTFGLALVKEGSAARA